MMLIKRVLQGALILTALLALPGCSNDIADSSLLLGGDVFLARGGALIYDLDDNSWGDLLIIRQEFSDSLFAVNLESPFGIFPQDEVSVDPSMNLCAPPESINLLLQAGIDLATTANNHAYDCEGSDNSFTAGILNEAGIDHAGEQGEVIFQEISGHTAAFLTLNDYSESYVNELLLKQVGEASKISDLLVISIHWGAEYQAGATEHQRQLADELVNAGADVIWGHHPHVLQPMEWITSSVDGHKALVIYSLGNLLSDQWMFGDSQKTVLVDIVFSDNGIQQVVLIPMRLDASSRRLTFIADKEIDWWMERLDTNQLQNENVKVEIWQQMDH